jgi:hypothetical protein
MPKIIKEPVTPKKQLLNFRQIRIARWRGLFAIVTSNLLKGARSQ